MYSQAFYYLAKLHLSLSDEVNSNGGKFVFPETFKASKTSAIQNIH